MNNPSEILVDIHRYSRSDISLNSHVFGPIKIKKIGGKGTCNELNNLRQIFIKEEQ